MRTNHPEPSETLRLYIKHAAPFGPIDAGLIKQEHTQVLRSLFDPQNKIFNALKSNPSLIIGRRGSGKTAYLHSIFLGDEFGIVHEVKASKTFSQVVDAIEKGTPSAVLTETVAELWDELFHFALLSEVAARYRDDRRELRLLDDYIAKHNLRDPERVDSLLWSIVRTLRNRPGGHLIGAIADVVKEITGIDYEAANSIALEVLEEHNEHAIVLLDTLEQYPTNAQSVANALSGLLKCIGQFNERNDRLSVRLCLPAELYHIFLDLSSNPLKDFTNSVTLHWVAGELLGIASRRLRLYLNLHFPDQAGSRKLETRGEVQGLLHQFLPIQVTNGLGSPEDSIAYILRHTQLQPRHLLMYLNSIFEKQQKRDRSAYPSISPDAVRLGISDVEHRLCQEVFSGYQALYPSARLTCEACIPNLPLVFSNGHLHRVFNRDGRKASGFVDYWDFRRLLIETGIVGRVIGETDRYVIGRFEYTEPHKLVVSTDDKLCLHPVFAEVFHFRKDPLSKAIYPYGSDPDGEDHRTWQFG